jgi:hypothetical protein
VHTALALRALLACGEPLDSGAVVRALKFISSQWVPGASEREHENYDLITGPEQQYARVALVHDVDAEVVLTLMEVDFPGLRAPLWAAAAAWALSNRQGAWHQKLGVQPTLWTVVPRALAATRLSRWLVGPKASVTYVAEAVAFTSVSTRRSLWLLLWEATRRMPFLLRVIAILLGASLAILTVVLAVKRVWDWGDVWGVAIFPFLVALFFLLLAKSDDGERQ